MDTSLVIDNGKFPWIRPTVCEWAHSIWRVRGACGSFVQNRGRLLYSRPMSKKPPIILFVLFIECGMWMEWMERPRVDYDDHFIHGVHRRNCQIEKRILIYLSRRRIVLCRCRQRAMLSVHLCVFVCVLHTIFFCFHLLLSTNNTATEIDCGLYAKQCCIRRLSY